MRQDGGQEVGSTLSWSKIDGEAEADAGMMNMGMKSERGVQNLLACLRCRRSEVGGVAESGRERLRSAGVTGGRREAGGREVGGMGWCRSL